MTREFEIAWNGPDRELGRKTLACPDLDAAVAAAWLDMPGIARAARQPCATITVRDVQSGNSITDDVVHHPPSNPHLARGLILFTCAIIFTLLMVWLGRRGHFRGGNSIILERTFIWIFPILVFVGIFAIVFGDDERRKAAEQWKKDFGDFALPHRPANPRSHRIVVAHFSWAAILISLLYLIVAGACLWYPLSERLYGGGWAIWHPFLIALGLGIAFIGAVPLRQLVFDGAAAVWIQSGAIVYGHPRLWASRSILGLQDARVGTHRPENGIPYRAILITSDDQSQPLWTAQLRQDPYGVADRLKSLLRLTGSGLRPT
jgi:predicted secreted protein